MIKYITKVAVFLLAFSLFINVSAKTISQLEQELNQSRNQLEENKEKTQTTKEQMANINNNIDSIQKEISSNIELISKINDEIQDLNEEIEVKKLEIEKLLNFEQVSNGDEAYLEYIFGATDFTDLIYRTAIVEQLSKYNKDLINAYEEKIEQNKTKTNELEQQRANLTEKQKQLESQYSKLGNSLSSLYEVKVDLEEAIKMEQSLINEYKKLGCSSNEEFSDCLKRLNTLPPDTAFWRPLISGRITSRFGYRVLNSSNENHEGIDIGTATGTPVYAIANGIVVATYSVGGTGNAVYIRHNVNGKKYTSIYMHLSKYNVKLNDVVSKDTIIGYSGCTGRCYGPHLHLGLVTGYAGVSGDSSADFSFWSSKFYANLTDPALVVNFPSGYGSFTDRTTYYR